MSGKMVEPLKLKGNEDIKSLINNVFANSGFNARRLAEACEIYSRMIKDNATICLTLAGAMTPIGMSGPVIEMMELGFIDFIISTGANLYHDLHRPFEYPVKQGEVLVDDDELNKLGISRIYDTYIDDNETLMSTDKSILEAIKDLPLERPISTAEFHYRLGDCVLKKSAHPEKSLLAQATRLNVPVYVSSPGDSSIGMNIAGVAARGKRAIIDPSLDILETTAIVMDAQKWRNRNRWWVSKEFLYANSANALANFSYRQRRSRLFYPAHHRFAALGWIVRCNPTGSKIMG